MMDRTPASYANEADALRREVADLRRQLAIREEQLALLVGNWGQKEPKVLLVFGEDGMFYGLATNNATALTAPNPPAKLAPIPPEMKGGA